MAIDAGNTRIKLAVFSGSSLMQVYNITYNQSNEIDILIDRYKISHLVISNVSAQKININSNKTKNLIIANNIKLPFINLYKTPETLGADRIALAAAAIKKNSNNYILVIDAGTCITYEFINNRNEYLGGLISPGLNMRLKAMHTFTGKLPSINSIEPTQLIGNSTELCMQHGAYWGVVNEINGIIADYMQNYPNLKVFITGGDSTKLLKHLKSNIFADENLLLEGLNFLLEHNVS